MTRARTNRRRYAALAALAVLLSGAFFAGTAWYARWSADRLPAMAEELGEVWMARAAHAEAAGALETALSYYERALAGRFHGPENRNHCEKRAGVVLLKLDRPAAAVPHLERAQGGPHRSLNGYRPWAEALRSLDRRADARKVVDAWLAAAEGHAASQADAHQMRGRLALDAGALDRAETAFQEALALDEEHPCLADLAQLYAAQGDRARARETLAGYLATAPPGDDTAAHWERLAAWTE